MKQLEARLEQLRLEVMEHPQKLQQALADVMARQRRQQMEGEERDEAAGKTREVRLAEALAGAQAELTRVREKVSAMCVRG